MKFYSEHTKKFYDSEEDCKNAEEEFNRQKAEKEEEEKSKMLAVSKEKKELANAIETADANLNKAYEEYELAQKEAKKIMDEAIQKSNEILTPAKENIKNAQVEKYKAISAFNKKYGTYTTTYTGDKAYNEFRRTSDWIDNLFSKFFSW